MQVIKRVETQSDTRPPTLRLDVRARPQTLEPSASPSPAKDRVRPPSRDILERELDRVQGAVQASEATFGQQLNWLLLAQALFLNAYLVVLVFGSGTALPGRRWLLAGLAIFAVVVAVFTYLALRGSRDAVSTLRATRRELETALAKQGRAPLFAPKGIMTAGLSSFAVSVLPAIFIVGWLVISVYALATPGKMPTTSISTEPTATGAPPAAPTATRSTGAARTAPARTAPPAPSSAAPPSTNNSSQPAPTPSAEPPKRTGFKW